MRSVAVSGASSFTGLCIVQAFHAAGWRVHPLLTRPVGGYDGVAARRVARLVEPVVAGAVEAREFTDWIRAARPDIWVHHHHYMTSFRSPDYDVTRADAVGLAPLDALLDALAASGCGAILHSGTVFEPGEGGSARRATPYGESKARVWTAMRERAARHGLPLAKVVIPNPVGPLENADRLTPVAIARARAGQGLELRQLKAVSDNLPGDVLGRRYVAIAEQLLAGARDIVARPSGWAATVPEWVEALNRELIAKRLGLTPVAPRLVPDDIEAPSLRNPPAEAEAVDWPAFWDDYAREVAAG